MFSSTRRNRQRFETFLKLAPLLATLFLPTACTRPAPPPPKTPAAPSPTASPAHAKPSPTPIAVSGPVYPNGIPAFATSFGSAPVAPHVSGWLVRCRVEKKANPAGQLEAITVTDMKNGPVVLLPAGSQLRGGLLPVGSAGEWEARSANGKGQVWKLAGAVETSASGTGEFAIRVSGMNTVRSAAVPGPAPAPPKPLALMASKSQKANRPIHQ